MSRLKFLQLERERVITRLNTDKLSRAKCLAELMDIDDEIEELSPKSKAERARLLALEPKQRGSKLKLTLIKPGS